jgi:putative ABC transport system ATP-binding protein
VEQIEFRGVTKSFSKGRDKVVAVTNINLAIPKGSFLSITGESGSGKSTLLRMIAGIERPSAGTIYVKDVDLWGLRYFKRRRFCKETFAQMHRMIDVRRYKTALDMVTRELPKSMDKAAKRAKALDMLDRVGLANRASNQPAKLSGGELRRVALARALATERPIVLAEEPTGQVDPSTAKALLTLIREINSQSGTTFLVVTDSEALAREATRTIRLEEGRIAYDHSRTFSPFTRH